MIYLAVCFKFSLKMSTFYLHHLDLLTLKWLLKWLDFPGGSAVKNCLHCKKCKRHKFNPRVGKIPWRKECQPTPVILPGEFHGQRSLVGYCPWDPKESDMTEHKAIEMVRFDSIVL